VSRIRCGGEAGQATAFVVVFAGALAALAGLVWDAGNLLAARREALDLAEQAARAGAQGIDLVAVRSGEPLRLDPARASELARDYLDASDEEGSVAVAGDRVTVTVTVDQPLLFLAGGERAVSGAGSARPVSTQP